MPPSRALANLERIKDSYDGTSTVRKLGLLRALAVVRFRSAGPLVRLHEVLCFLRAYPDNAHLAAQVERMLARFSRRTDLKRHRNALASSGIAGTTIRYRFFWPTARWLAQCWPGEFRLDRRDREAEGNIAGTLPMLVTPGEAQWLREKDPDGYTALDRLRGRTTDATFLARAIEALPGDSFTREAFFDRLDPSCELLPGRNTPSRTLGRCTAAPASFRSEPLHRPRPDLREEIQRPPRMARTLSRHQGSLLIELARGALITRQRDLDAFAYGDARDVRIVDQGNGLAFALVGMLPERRTLLPAIYGILTLQNGVPVGYSQADVLAGSAAISFNTFATFRGGETAHTFARLLATVGHVFGASSFSIEPYQLGQDNDEGIETGAWWFYYKMGFRPRAAAARRIARAELARMAANPRHRSSAATLRKLADWHLFFDLDPARSPGLPPLVALGERVTTLLARQTTLDRSGAIMKSSHTLMRLAGLSSLRGFSPDELQAWQRWCPLVLALPGVARWSAVDRRALVRVLRAKGGRRESDFAALFAAHPRLARALFALR